MELMNPQDLCSSCLLLKNDIKNFINWTDTRNIINAANPANFLPADKKSTKSFVCWFVAFVVPNVGRVNLAVAAGSKLPNRPNNNLIVIPMIPVVSNEKPENFLQMDSYDSYLHPTYNEKKTFTIFTISFFCVYTNHNSFEVM